MFRNYALNVIDDYTKQRPLKHRPSGFALAIVAAAVSGLLLIGLGAPMQLLNIPFGLWFAEVFAFLGPGWIILRWAGYDPWGFVGVRRLSRGEIGLGFAMGAANFFGVIIPLQFLQQPLIPQRLKEQFDTSRLFQNQSPLELILIVAAIAIAAPFCEEFVFRGIIQKGLAARFTQRAAIFATAVLFSAFHLDPVGFVSRVELGILFGVLYQRSGSLWPGAMAHAANNLVSASLFFLTRNIAPSNETEQAWQYVAILSFAGLSVMAWLVAIANRKQAPAQAQAIVVDDSSGPLAEDASQAPDRPSGWRLLTPWLAAAAASLLLLVALDRRGVVLNLYDLAYHLPALDKDAPIAERQARDQLQDLRAKVRRGQVSLDEYLRQRKALRARFYESARSRKTALPSSRDPLP